MVPAPSGPGDRHCRGQPPGWYCYSASLQSPSSSNSPKWQPKEGSGPLLGGQPLLSSPVCCSWHAVTVVTDPHPPHGPPCKLEWTLARRRVSGGVCGCHWHRRLSAFVMQGLTTFSQVLVLYGLESTVTFGVLAQLF